MLSAISPNPDRDSALSSNSEDIVRLVKDELEHMRTMLATTLIKQGSAVDRDEILDAIREGIEESRNPRPHGTESILSNTSELLDAFQDGVEGIRADMAKLVDRPVDLSSNYEILDTLKSGIESVRADIDKLHSSQRDISDTMTARGGAVVMHNENLISTEIEGLKVMITQLRIKIEAIDTMAPHPAPEPAEARLHKEDLLDLHTAIKSVHDSVRDIPPPREPTLSEAAASKDDTLAIETLLRNIKAQLDDFSLPEIDMLAKTSQLEMVELLLRELKDNVEETSSKKHHAESLEELIVVKTLVKGVAHGVSDFAR